MNSEMHRTNFLLSIVLSLALSFHAGASGPPNIVVIMADDMGYSDLGCFGGEIATPNLDSLANGGLRFRNFYSENMCWVSRAAMLTGVYHKASLFDNAIHPMCPTIAEVLSQKGYRTCMSGKWHLAGKPYTVYPSDRGFDDFYGMLGGAASFFAPAFLTRNRENVEHEFEAPDFYFTNTISEEAVSMVQSSGEEPLFLYLAYNAAHWPLHALPSDIEAYSGKYSLGWDQLRAQRLKRMKALGIVEESIELSPRHEKVPAWDDEEHQHWQQRRMEVYAAQVTCMDRGIGRVIESLRDTGRWENTLVLFMVDNGGCHVEYGPDRKGEFLKERTRDGRPMRPGNLPSILPGPEDTFQSYGHGWANASNTPYRLFKQYDHEGGIRTPLIAHWPRGIKNPGRIESSVSHLVDIFPTVLDVSGAPLPSGMPLDGRSLASSFENEEQLRDHETLFFSHNKGKALRKNNFKAVAVSKEGWELYDLSNDPLEMTNLASEEPERLRELVQLWNQESKRLEKQSSDFAKLSN